MSYWQILEYAAWAGSALLLLWLVADFLRVNRQYSEDFLLSSREAYDELLEYEKSKKKESMGGGR